MGESNPRAVFTNLVYYFCDEEVVDVSWGTATCNKVMKSDGLAFLTNPPRYQHSCPDGHKKTLDAMYPLIRTTDLLGRTVSQTHAPGAV